MVNKFLGNLRSRFAKMQQVVHQADLRDIHQLVVLAGDNEIDGVDADVDMEHFEAVLQRQGFTDQDLEINLKLYAERKRLHALAVRKDDLQARALQLEAEVETLDREEAERHRQAMITLGRKREEARLASDAANVAIGAASDLYAGADDRPDAAVVNADLKTLIRRIEAVREKLDSSDREDGDTRNSNLWATVDRRPALLARQTREMLADKKAGYSVQRRAELQRLLTTAEKEVARCEAELVELMSQHAELNAKLTWSPADSLRPENFKLRRHTPTADEQRKRHAAKLGFGPNDPGYRVSR